MPSHHDNATGCSKHVNRPKPGGLFGSPPMPGTGPESAQSPYAGTLQLHGCHRIGGAKYYRLLHSYEGGPELPFLGLDFYPPRLVGPPWWTPAVPDPQGWYEVLEPEDEYVFPNWLINWPTRNGSFPDGKYAVRLQLADGSKNPLPPPAEFSDPVTFRIDNRRPSVNFDQVRWRLAGSGGWAETFTWPFSCVVIHRPKGHDIEIEVTWSAWAGQWRSAYISARGCGGSNPTPASDIASQQHWHESTGDNSVTRSTLWNVPHTLPGSYTFWVHSTSRAFNPAGDGGGGGPGTNWLTDYDYLWVTPSIVVTVIDA